MAYPATRSPDQTTILTHWDKLYHLNAVPVKRHAEAVAMAKQMTAHLEEAADILQMMMAFLADLPVEPLISAEDRQKGSVLGLLTLGYVLAQMSQFSKLERMLKNGDGVVIVRIEGTMAKHNGSVLLFEDWRGYQAFLKPILAAGRMAQGKGSTLL